MGGLATIAVFGAALRAIGRGFGRGTFGLAAKATASAANADKPAVSTSVAPKIVHRLAAARPNRTISVFRSESSKRARPQVYFIEVVEKLLNLPPTLASLHHDHGKI